mmetsp:Transcript_25957/g.54405  ORF Transcript_25957/g.54405 Transcript_25957/m.54405 type:complete len:87 (+) Transcript_25957:2-262(+)
MCLIRQANIERHGHILTHLENSYMLGNDKFPTTVTEAYNLMLNMKNPNQAQRSNRNAGVNDRLTFLTHGKTGDDNDDGGIKPCTMK